MNEKNRIFIIDDEPDILSSLTRLLLDEPYEVQTFTDPDALFLALLDGNVTLVISDQRMPKMEGDKVLEKVKELAPETLRIMLTGYADINATIKAVNKGNIYRYLTKPWDDDELKLNLRQAVDQYKLNEAGRKYLEVSQKKSQELLELNKNLEDTVQERARDIVSLNKELEQGFQSTLRILSRVCELNHPEMGGHMKRVSELACALALKLGLAPHEVAAVKEAALLHDVGHIASEDSEYSSTDKVPNHVIVAVGLLSEISRLEQSISFIRHHHENVDGSGFPSGLSFDQIPMGARILRVADAFDEFVNLGISTQATPALALAEIRLKENSYFDARIVDALANHLKEKGLLEKEDPESEINLFQLRSGMMTSAPVKTLKGQTLLGAEFVLTHDMIQRLWKRHAEDPLNIEIRVYRASVPRVFQS